MLLDYIYYTYITFWCIMSIKGGKDIMIKLENNTKAIELYSEIKQFIFPLTPNRVGGILHPVLWKS